jgi:hypothetical protein
MVGTLVAWSGVRRHKHPSLRPQGIAQRHRSLLRRADVEARHGVVTRPPAARHEPSFSGDDLVL